MNLNDVELRQELDALRAENERLKKDNELASNELVEYGKLLAQSSIDENHDLRVENERLRAALEQIANGPDVPAFNGMRQIAREALRTTDPRG